MWSSALAWNLQSVLLAQLPGAGVPGERHQAVDSRLSLMLMLLTSEERNQVMIGCHLLPCRVMSLKPLMHHKSEVMRSSQTHTDAGEG